MSISLGDALLKLAIDSSGFKKALKDADDQVNATTKKWQTGLKVVGGAFTALGGASLKFINDAKNLNAQLGMTAENLGITTAQMRKLALDTANAGLPLGEVQRSFDLLARSGVTSTDELRKVTEVFDALGDVAGVGADTIATMLIPAYKAFNMELPKSTAELDKFTWLIRYTNVDMGGFSSMLTYLAPNMQKLNITMDDAVAILAILADRGITGTAATRMLRSAITDLSQAQEKAAEAAQKHADELERANEAAATAAERLEMAQDGVSEAQKRVTQADKGVVNAKKRVVDANKQVTKANEGVVEAQNAIVEANQAVQDAEAEVSLQRQDLTLDLRENAVALGKAKAGTLEYERLVLKGTQIQRQMAELDDRVTAAKQRVTEATDRLADAQDRVVEAQEGVTEAQDNVLEAQDRVTEAREDVLDAGKKEVKAEAELTKANTELVKASAPVTDEQKSINDLLGITSTEMDAAKAKIADAAGATDKYSKIAESNIGLLQELRNTFQELTVQAGTFLTPLEPIFALVTALGPAMMLLSTATGMAAIKTKLLTVSTIAQNAAWVVTTFVTQGLRAGMIALNLAFAANPVFWIIAGLVALIAVIVLVVKNWDKIKKVALAVGEAIKKAWNKVVEFFKSLWNRLVNIFKQYWQYILLVIFPAGGIVALLVKYWGPITEFFSGIWDKVKAVFMAFFEWHVQQWQNVIAAVTGVWNSIVSFFSGLWNTITGAVGDVFKDVVKWFTGPVDTIIGVWNTLKSFFVGLWEGIQNVFKTVINAVIGYFEGFVNFFIDGINWIIGGLNKLKIDIPTWIPEWLGGGKTWGVNIGTVGRIALPRLAAGGIVTEPTALIAGEAGDEVIMPLDRLQPNITYVNVYIGNKKILEFVDEGLDRRKRIQQVV